MVNIIDRFNVIAPFYDRLADFFFGKALLKSQTQNLGLIPGDAKVLVLGGGTGRWLNELLEGNDSCKVWYVEASSKMIALAKQNSNHSERIVFIHGTELNLPEIEFDVIITYFFLDMFSNEKLATLVKRLTSHMSPNGLWLVADFVSEKYWHKIYLKVMYFCFGAIGAIDTKSLPAWEVTMKGNFLDGKYSYYFYNQFIKSEAFMFCEAQMPKG